jgi:hypothetical protein
MHVLLVPGTTQNPGPDFSSKEPHYRVSPGEQGLAADRPSGVLGHWPSNLHTVGWDPGLYYKTDSWVKRTSVLYLTNQNRTVSKHPHGKRCCFPQHWLSLSVCRYKHVCRGLGSENVIKPGLTHL